MASRRGGSALAQFYQPVLVGLLFVVAQLFTFLALQKGDVSVVTPVLGSKVLLVAFSRSFARARPAGVKLAGDRSSLRGRGPGNLLGFYTPIIN